MRRCIDPGTGDGRRCPDPGQGQAGSIAPDLIFRAVRRAFETGAPLKVTPYPISSSFFGNIGFRLLEKGPEMALDHEELKRVLADMEGMIGEEKDLTSWDILRDYVEELGQRSPVLVWPSEQLDRLIKDMQSEEGAGAGHSIP